MSWVDDIKGSIEITTGDGVVYSPLYRIKTKTVDYNISEFDFPNVDGTLVKKSMPRGSRHNFEFIFQGSDHLEVSENFEISSKDQRPWKIYNPIYGNLVVQPISLTFDSSGLNTTIITGEFIETITDELPRITVDSKVKIANDYLTTKENLSESFNISANASDSAVVSNNNSSVYALGADSVKSGPQANEYFQLFTKANTAISNFAFNASLVAQYTVDLYSYPSLFLDTVKNRLRLLLNQFEAIVNVTDNLNEKYIYQMSGAGIIIGMVNSTINPIDGDYTSKNEVLAIINTILDTYNSYIETIDTMQSSTGSELDSFIPDYDNLNNLSNLINYATANLFNISLGAKQERTVILEKDSNIILLAHRFYGLEVDDSTIDKFIDENNIGISELLGLSKGRKVVYYV